MVGTISAPKTQIEGASDVGSDSVSFETTSESASTLTGRLAQLGLGPTELTNIISLLEAARSEQGSTDTASPQGQRSVGAQRTIKLYLAEEQQILREAYHSFFSAHSTVSIAGTSSDTSTESLVEAATTLDPDVMLIGVKTLQPETVERLEIIRDANPKVAVVLLFAFYDAKGIKALREFSRDTSVGCAYLLKHTIDTVEQLTQVVHSVAESRIIVDPIVMEGLIRNDDFQKGFMNDLTPKAVEVLGWLSRGYRNDTIAEILERDVKTVERHINNIYSSLQDEEDESKHPRVQAVLKYLEATGLLYTEQLIEE